MGPNPNLGKTLRSTAFAAFKQNPNTRITNNYGHTFFQKSSSRFLFMTSWPPSNNQAMTTSPSITADPNLPVTHAYVRGDGDLSQTGAISLTIAADVTGVPGDVNMIDMIDMNPLSVNNDVPPTNNGVFTAPAFNSSVLRQTSKALLRESFDLSNTTPHSVMIAQSAPLIKALLDAASSLGVRVHRTDRARLLSTFGLQMSEIDYGGARNSGVYLLERDGRFILLVAVPSASIAAPGPASVNRNGVVTTTFNAMQITRALTGQPLLDPESSAYIGGTRPSSSSSAMVDLLARSNVNVPYISASQRGGKATVDSHGPQLANGGRAGGRGRGGLYIRQQGANRWIRFRLMSSCANNLGIKKSTLSIKLKKSGGGLFRITKKSITVEWKDGKGEAPEDWDWAYGEEPEEEDEDEDGEGGEGGEA